MLGGDVTVQADGLFAVDSRGFDYTTHGPDPKVADEPGSPLTPGAPERAPHCADNPATDYFQQVLYGYPGDGENQLEANRDSIRGQIRRNNALLNRDAQASGGPEADFRVLCDPDGQIKVSAFPVSGGSSASFTNVVNSARDAGFTNGRVDYTIFYDGASSTACGVGNISGDESPGVNNANNTGGDYGMTYRGCWFSRTSMHENAHNEGAAQYNAPNSTGSGWHCNERNDILCYVDGGDRNQSLIDCPIAPPSPSDWFYDCNWNTYFDSVTEPGEWLASHWNIGSSLNRFITFGTDTRVPNTTITSAPSGPTGNAQFEFTSSEEPSTFQCSVGLPGHVPSFSACTSPQTYTGLADGNYEFVVRARDAALNTDASPASATFTFDGTPPDTKIDAGPSGVLTHPTASFSFSANGAEAAAGFECRLDGGSFTACVSPKGLEGLSDGFHTFAVRARDVAGNADPSPAEQLFAVDTTAPDTSITGGPPAKLRVRKKAKVSFAFASADTTAKFQCSFDGSAFASCSSPRNYSGVGRGSHQFLVRAIDAVGNVDQAPASRSFKVKRKRPRR